MKRVGFHQREGQDVAVVSLEGRVKGRRGDELNAGGTMSGTVYVSVKTGEVLLANATVRADVDLVLGRKPSKAIGTLSVSIKRPASVPQATSDKKGKT